MTLKSKKRLLSAGSLALTCAAIGVLVWGFSTAAPPDAEQRAAPRTVAGKARGHAAKSPASAEPVISRGSFEGIWDRPLRRPLFDPPPPPAVVQKNPPPPLHVQLLATMVESESAAALLKLSNGEVVFRKVGEVLGADYPQARIAKIEPGTVCVRRGQEEAHLQIDDLKK